MAIKFQEWKKKRRLYPLHWQEEKFFIGASRAYQPEKLWYNEFIERTTKH